MDKHEVVFAQTRSALNNGGVFSNCDVPQRVRAAQTRSDVTVAGTSSYCERSHGAERGVQTRVDVGVAATLSKLYFIQSAIRWRIIKRGKAKKEKQKRKIN